MMGNINDPFGEEYHKLEKKEYYTIEDILKLDAYTRVENAAKKYGLEGAEEVIKEVYANPKTRDYLLKILYYMWGGK